MLNAASGSKRLYEPGNSMRRMIWEWIIAAEGRIAELTIDGLLAVLAAAACTASLHFIVEFLSAS